MRHLWSLCLWSDSRSCDMHSWEAFTTFIQWSFYEPTTFVVTLSKVMKQKLPSKTTLHYWRFRLLHSQSPYVRYETVKVVGLLSLRKKTRTHDFEVRNQALKKLKSRGSIFFLSFKTAHWHIQGSHYSEEVITRHANDFVVRFPATFFLENEPLIFLFWMWGNRCRPWAAYYTAHGKTVGIMWNVITSSLPEGRGAPF